MFLSKLFFGACVVGVIIGAFMFFNSLNINQEKTATGGVIFGVSLFLAYIAYKPIQEQEKRKAREQEEKIRQSIAFFDRNFKPTKKRKSDFNAKAKSALESEDKEPKISESEFNAKVEAALHEADKESDKTTTPKDENKP